MLEGTVELPPVEAILFKGSPLDGRPVVLTMAGGAAVGGPSVSSVLSSSSASRKAFSLAAAASLSFLRSSRLTRCESDNGVGCKRVGVR